MKNLHIIPTEKPSRLVRNSNENTLKLCIQTLPLDKEIYCYPQHIYITSDEFEMFEWYYHTKYHHVVKSSGIPNMDMFKAGCRRVILTTDQDLINDGVQKIDDEFLEWFVKNPSCEEVEVKEKQHFEADKSKRKNPLNGVYYSYKIIIPKELKQDPLEQAAKEYAEMHLDVSGTLGKYLVKAVFQDGVKWQAERMYSEEEVIELLTKRCEHFGTSVSPFDKLLLKQDLEWFNNIKKK